MEDKLEQEKAKELMRIKRTILVKKKLMGEALP